MPLREKIEKILQGIPNSVSVVAACKGRSAAEIQQAIGAGIKIIGENYVQDAEKVFPQVRSPAERHFIGHLQKNKVKRALAIFSCIQTVDSLELAEEIDRRAKEIGKVIPIFIEINIAGEKTKFGCVPEKAKQLVEKIAKFRNVRAQGLMAMEPYSENPEESRPYFRRMKKLFDEIKAAKIPNAEMKFLSMGMSGSYKVAIEEGSNMVRIGTAFFGERK